MSALPGIANALVCRRISAQSHARLVGISPRCPRVESRFPHTGFLPDELAAIEAEDEWETQNSNERGESLRIASNNEDAAAGRLG